MQNKQISIRLFALIFSMMIGFNLSAQTQTETQAEAQVQAQTQAQQKPGKTGKKLRFITGLGLDIGYLIQSSEAKRNTKGLMEGGFGSSFSIQNIGAHIPIVLAFQLAKPYRLGLGVHLSIAYHVYKLTGRFTGECIEEDGSFSYGRNIISLTPVFYNAFSMGEIFSLSFSVGPSFSLTFGDKQTVNFDKGGILLNSDGTSATFVVKDSFQFSLGILADLGFEFQLGKMLGMGVDFFFQWYFTGQKAAFTQTRWLDYPNYQGSFGVSVSFLILL